MRARNVNEQHRETLTRNERLALRLTVLVGTMWCFYAFVVLALVPLAVPRLLPEIQFVSSGVLQLVLLPLILVGQNLMGRHDSLRAENDYRVDRQAEAEIQALQAAVGQLHVKLDALLAVTPAPKEGV